MTDEITPALTAEQWEKFTIGWLKSRHIESLPEHPGWVLFDCWPCRFTNHALAALALQGQPFGFTQADVDNLRSIPDGTGYGSIDDPEWFASLIERIAALLPP